MHTVIQREVTCFADLKAQVDAIQDQTVGDPCAISNIGELYVPFFASGLARPGDEATIERHVSQEMARQINAYCEGKGGRIYWRERLSMKIAPYPIVVHLDANGPDTDFITNQRCVMDKNWVVVTAYCRFVRAHMRTMEVEPKAA